MADLPPDPVQTPCPGCGAPITHATEYQPGYCIRCGWKKARPEAELVALSATMASIASEMALGPVIAELAAEHDAHVSPAKGAGGVRETGYRLPGVDGKPKVHGQNCCSYCPHDPSGTCSDAAHFADLAADGAVIDDLEGKVAHLRSVLRPFVGLLEFLEALPQGHTSPIGLAELKAAKAAYDATAKGARAGALSYLCAACGTPAQAQADSLDSGTTLEGCACGQPTVVDLDTPDARAQRYAAGERASRAEAELEVKRDGDANERAYRAGVEQAERCLSTQPATWDFGPSPYPEGSLDHHWYTRGTETMARLMRAIMAEQERDAARRGAEPLRRAVEAIADAERNGLVLPTRAANRVHEALGLETPR